MIEIKTFKRCREHVNAIKVLYVKRGVVGSQNPRYELPLWFFILAILGSRRNNRWTTVNDIVENMAKFNLIVSPVSVLRTLYVMMDPTHFIQPHIRGCGVSCYDAVEICGGVVKTTKLGGPTAYALGASQKTIAKFRRNYNVTLKPRD